MNILVIANIAPFETGGAEVQVRRLAEAWLKQGQRVTIVGNRIPSCKITVNNSKHTFNCVHISTVLTNRFTRAVSYAVSLSWFIITHQKEFDLIYCRFLQEAALVIGLLKTLRIVSLPFVACPACSGIKGDVAFIEKMPFSNLLRCILNKTCDTVNSISPQIENELIAFGIDKIKITHIPNGISLPSKYAQKRISSDNKLCIFVGRLTEQKGLPYLMEAIHKLAQQNHYPYLTIIGEGPDRKKLEELICRLNIQRQVKFCGKIVHEEINDHLCNYDIFVLPSLYEGHPNALLEAMAIGLPALVTKCGGSEYFVDNSVGRVAEAGNAESLAQALQELLELSDEELQAMGQAARERVKNNFDIDVIADKYIQLFKQHI